MIGSILFVVDILMWRSPIFEDLYSPKLDFRILVRPVCIFCFVFFCFRCHLGFLDAPTRSLYT